MINYFRVIKKTQERRRASNYDDLIEGLTEEEVNSNYLSLIEYGWPMDDILLHPKLKRSTLDKAAYELTQHDEYDDIKVWCDAMNILFAHGAANPYHPVDGQDMFPLMTRLPYLAVKGDLRAPMPKDPKDAMAYLKIMQRSIERRLPEETKQATLSKRLKDGRLG